MIPIHNYSLQKRHLAWLAAAGVFVWLYWSSLGHLWQTWATDEDYRHGFFVPIFALALLWIRRRMAPPSPMRTSLWGTPFFAVWAVTCWVSVRFNYGTLVELSMLPFLAGVVLTACGWQGLRWTWPSIVFLLFMIPLPGTAQGLARERLQEVATQGSTYIIQTLGIAAVAQGNVIQLRETALEVAPACGGLRMMVVFAALCVATAFVVRRPLWEKLVMIASAAPIAIAANVLRIVITAVCYETAGRWPGLVDLDATGNVAHGWAAYLMMPIGLLLLLAEMSLLTRLMIEVPKQTSAADVRPCQKLPVTGRHTLRKRRSQQEIGRSGKWSPNFGDRHERQR